MAIYEFKGMNKNGKNVQGQVEADSMASAQALVKKSGVYLVSIEDKSKKKSSSSIFPSSKKVNIRTLSMFSRNLSSMLKAGIPLVDAIDTISKQTEHVVMGEALNYIKDSINAGKSFNKSLEYFPSIFNKTFVAVCEAGEISGTLDISLLRLAQWTENQSNLQNKVRSALIYPAIMIVFAFFMIIFLLTYVVPKIRVLFEENTMVTIPWYSSFLLELSDLLRQYWMSMILISLFSIFVFWKWKNSNHGKKIWDRFSLKIPVFGRLIRSLIIARMSMTLSTLLKGGVALTDSLNIVKNVVNNQKIYSAIVEAKESIERGSSLSAPLVQSGEFPPMVSQMLRVGEKTGQLEKMLSQISEIYDNQVKTEVNTLTSVLEPVMLIIMGGIIAFIIFSTMIPLLQMYNLTGI